MAFTKSGLRILSGASETWMELDRATGKETRRVEPLRLWETEIP